MCATSSSASSSFDATIIAGNSAVAHLWAPPHHSSIPPLRRTRVSAIATVTEVKMAFVVAMLRLEELLEG